MEPENINNRFERTQKKLLKRIYIGFFTLGSIFIYTLISLFMESRWTRSGINLIIIILIISALIYIIRSWEIRMQKNRDDAGQGKKIKHIKTIL